MTNNKFREEFEAWYPTRFRDASGEHNEDMFETWQASRTQLLKELSSEDMVEAAENAVESEFYSPIYEAVINGKSEPLDYQTIHKKCAVAVLTAIKKKLGEV